MPGRMFPYILSFLISLFLSFPSQGQQTGKRIVERIAFGSCADEDEPQPIWKSILHVDPDLFLFIGDNIYGDTEDMNVLRAKYKKLANIDGYRKLQKTCPVLAVWDDHDFGVNDGGTEYPKKRESQEIFLDFFDVPKDSPRRNREGIYHSQMFGPEDKRIQIILLDTRYHRSPLKKGKAGNSDYGPYVADHSKDKRFLDPKQWKWLEKELQKPARLRIIASSIQVIPEDHGWEKWANFPAEREKLFNLIRDTKANGVLFLSGDRHLAELSMMNAGIGYPAFDLTSSGLNKGFQEWRLLEPNRHRIATMNHGNNFGLVTIDWNAKDPLIRLQIRDEAGEVTIQEKVRLSLLQSGTLLPKGSTNAKLSNGEMVTKEVIEKFLHKECCVQLNVRGFGMSRGGTVFLNSKRNYKNPGNFTVVIKDDVVGEFQKLGVKNLRSHFLHKQIKVTGTLTLYQNRPEIILSDPKQIEFIPKK